jgi:hypothetical protein
MSADATERPRRARWWILAGALVVLLAVIVVAVEARRSHPRDIPEATIIRDCPSPSGGPPAKPETRRPGPLVPAAAPAEARLCRGDPERDTEPLPYADLTDGTGQLVQALNALPTTPPQACPGTQPERVVDLVLDYPQGKVVVALGTAGCGPVYVDGQTRFGAPAILDLAERLIG